MWIMKVSSVNFTGTTKQGNEYDKTKVGKLTGMVAGAGWTAYKATKNFGKKMTFSERRNMVTELQSICPEGVNFRTFKNESIKIAKKIAKTGTAIAGAITIAVGLGVGAIVDACINKSRAKKADKAV